MNERLRLNLNVKTHNTTNNHASNSNDYNPYTPSNIPLFEAMYGENLISLGGTAAIENMFSGITLTDLHALDLGFGLGGAA